MPQQSKKTPAAGAKTSTQKGTSTRKKTKKSSADVGELLQNLSSNRNSSSGDAFHNSSSDERTGKGRGGTINASRDGVRDGAVDPQRARPQTAVRGGRGRGRGRSSLADKETAGTQLHRGKSGKTEKGKGNNRNKETAPGQTSPSKRKHSTGPREHFDDDDFQERQLSAQSVSKWQTMTKTSQEFLHQNAESAISIVLNETSNSSHSEVQDHLNSLKKRLMTNCATLKVPAKRQPNYKDMEEHTRVLEAALVETSSRVECLDKEVHLQQQSLVLQEEELEKLEAVQISSDDNRQELTKKLHPLLQGEKQDMLGLPPVPESHNGTLKQFENIGSSCQQQVLDSLRHWNQSQSEGEAIITDFIDSMSAIHAALPP